MTTIQRDFEAHYLTVLKWIVSCDSQQQIPVCNTAVEKLVKEKFQQAVENKEIDRIIYLNALSDLTKAVQDVALIIVAKKSKGQ